jgi:hypothetical protein
VTAIGDYAFIHANALNNSTYSVGIRDITLPSSVTSIGDYAFKGLDECTRIVIPDNSGLTSLGNGAFAFCYALGNLFLPSTITTIPQNTFYQCSAFGESSRKVYAYDSTASSLTETTETIPALQRGLYGLDASQSDNYSHALPSLLSFREAAFAYCTSLKSFTCPTNLDFIDNYCFRNDTKLTTVTFNNYLRKIGDYAFQGCTGFTASDSACNFSNSVCPYLEDVGINIFTDTTLTSTDDEGSTSSSKPHFITQTAPFYMAYGWATAFDPTSSGALGTSFTIPEGTIGLARDVLANLPGCHNEGGSFSGIQTAYGVKVTLCASLVHASNNFIRFSGDDFNQTVNVPQSDLSGSCGLSFSTLYSSSYKAITIPSTNSHFQILDVKKNGTSSGAVDYHQLVNFYIGLNPQDKSFRPEARLLTCTRYAYWDSRDTFTDDEGNAIATVVQPTDATLFAQTKGYNGKDLSGATNATYKINGYTILSAQCGQGAVNFYNHAFSADSSFSYSGKTANGGSTYSAALRYKGAVPVMLFDATSDYALSTAFFASSNYADATALSVTLGGVVGDGDTSVNDVLDVYPVDASGAVVSSSAYVRTTLTASGSFSKSVSLTFTSTYSVSGIKVVCSSLSGASIFLNSISATLTYDNGNATIDQADSTANTFTNRDWDYSGASLLSSKFSNPMQYEVFGKYVRVIEDHVLEGYCYDQSVTSTVNFLLPSTLEYVGRDLTSGDILLATISTKNPKRKNNYFLLQDAVFNENWSRYLGISSMSGGDAVTLESTVFFAFSSAVTYNGLSLWGVL